MAIVTSYTSVRLCILTPEKVQLEIGTIHCDMRQIISLKQFKHEYHSFLPSLLVNQGFCFQKQFYVCSLIHIIIHITIRECLRKISKFQKSTILFSLKYFLIYILNF